MHIGTHKLASEALQALDRPVGEARGLPPEAYVSPEVFTAEELQLFRRTWVPVCFSHEVEQTGDVLPIRVAGSEVVILRDEQGQVRVFHNICRHRSAVVVQKPEKRRKLLRCPYHCWTYRLDGSLMNAPYFDGKSRSQPGGACKDTSLVPVRCGEWEGVVFVNLDGNAQSLADYVDPLASRWRQYRTDECPLYKTEERSIPANWKIVMEGLLEVYHEQFIHPALSLRIDDAGEKTWEDIVQGDLMGFRSVMPEDNPDHPSLDIPRLPGMPGDGVAPTEIFLLFPLVSMNILDNHLVRTIWTPVSHLETRWRSTWHFAPGAADTEEGAKQCDSIVDFWISVREEDLDAVMAVQRGMESIVPPTVQTRYSPFWEPILVHFHRKVAQSLVQE